MTAKEKRTLPLPLTIMPEMNRQLGIVWEIHRQDLEGETAGVFMFDSIEMKYRNEGREFH